MNDLTTRVPMMDCVEDSGRNTLTRGVEIPLRDLEYAIEAHLLENAVALPMRTRSFLAQVRDGLGAIAERSRRLAEDDHLADPIEGPRADVA